MLEKNCKEFLDLLASKEPVPGGGGAAALAGALAAALTSMVCNLTFGKKKYEVVQLEISELLLDSEVARGRLGDLVNEDARVFAELMQAYKMPKNTEEEKALRTQTISERSIDASEVPFEIATVCLIVLELSDKAAKIGNQQLISDAGVAALLARAALRSACYNVLINLSAIKDGEYIRVKLQEMKELKRRAFELEEKVLESTEKVLLGQ